MKKIQKLTLLHSNDIHGDFLAENIDDRFVGGVSLLSGYVNGVRSEQANVLYAVAGDMFRGSIIDSEYKGVSTVEIMNLIQPDVVTIGNHEIDYGIAHLLFLEKCARFPIINANMYIKPGTIGLSETRLFKPYRIIRIGELKVLFIGIITEDILSQAQQDDLIGSFIGVTDAAKEIGRICNAYKSVDIDLTVILTHIGIDADIRLARQLDAALGIDIIIGGHSHTTMTEPRIENGILIAHAGTGTDFIGRFDLDIDTASGCIDSYKWSLVPINNETCRRDVMLENTINKYKDVTDEKYDRVVTRLNRTLTHPARNAESEIGNLFADIFRDSLGVDIMFLASGSIRSETFGPIVEYRDLVETFPFDDELYMIRVSGASLRHMLLFMLRDEAFTARTEFYQLSEGMELVYSRSRRTLEKFRFFGKEIKDDDEFTVGIQTYHFSNIKKFLDVSQEEIERLAPPQLISTSCIDVLDEYLSSHRKLDSRIEGRITVVE